MSRTIGCDAVALAFFLEGSEGTVGLHSLVWRLHWVGGLLEATLGAFWAFVRGFDAIFSAVDSSESLLESISVVGVLYIRTNVAK